MSRRPTDRRGSTGCAAGFRNNQHPRPVRAVRHVADRVVNAQVGAVLPFVMLVTAKVLERKVLRRRVVLLAD